MTTDDIRNKINFHYNEIKKLSDELFDIEMKKQGYIKIQENEIPKILCQGDVYRLGSDSQTSFILARDNCTIEVSVFSENDWTQILIRPFIYDHKCQTYIRKVTDTDLIKLLSSIKQSGFQEL